MDIIIDRFQGISCLISKELLLVKNTNFFNQRPYRSVQNEQILRIFKEITCLILIRFQRRYILLVKNINFSSQILYRSVLLHENFQCFDHDISLWILHIYPVSWESILNLKSTRSCPSVFKANFVHCSQIKNLPVETI